MGNELGDGREARSEETWERDHHMSAASIMGHFGKGEPAEPQSRLG